MASYFGYVSCSGPKGLDSEQILRRGIDYRVIQGVKWTGPTVLVTGAGGFLGRHLLRPTLGLGDSIRVVAWSVPTMGSLDQYGAFDKVLADQRPSIVIHLAWLSTSADGYRSDPANGAWATTSARIASMTVDRGARFIGIGSGLEAHERETGSAYTRAKLTVRAHLEAELPAHSWLWLRPFWVFYAREGRPRVLRQVSTELAAGRIPNIAEAGRELDFVEVRDVASAIRAAIRSGTTGVRDIGSGVRRSVSSLVAATSGWTPPPKSLSPDRDTVDPVANISWLQALGWSPEYTDEVFRDS